VTARAATRRARIRRTRAAAALAAIAAVAAALGYPLLASSSSSSTAPPSSRPTSARDDDRRPEHRPLGEADGALPGRTTVFDDRLPGIANLDPALRAALRRAAAEAAREGVELVVDSGWRSRAYQEHLLREAVSKYGSAEEAARWVATPDTSAHVSGDAADVGPSAAARWLSERGARYGLCGVYRNEPWHFELRPDAVHHGCPPAYADPTEDPRTRGARDGTGGEPPSVRPPRRAPPGPQGSR
jgi:hypothetical protein